MLTPKFEINQSGRFVVLKIFAPYTKVSEVDITIAENEFMFFAQPYLLRLSFPGEVEDEGSTCQYDADLGSYTVNVKKAKQHEVFENLDLLTTLLRSKKPNNESKPLIEVLSQKVELPDAEKTFSISWTRDDKEYSRPSYGFGFANQLQDMPNMESLIELLCVEDPSRTSTEDRRSLRLEIEEEKFDSDHYLADLYEDEAVMETVDYQPWWNADCDVTFSSEERETMQSLPNKEYLLDEYETKVVFMGLVDILFGYAYDVRVTEGETNVESSWTIRTLSSNLACCDTARDLEDQLITSYRRILCYPQFRCWKLAERIRKDVVAILQRGRRCVLKCLLQIFHIFRTADSAPCYLLNDLYIRDYCVWIQKEEHCDVTLKSLARAIDDLELTKPGVGFELELVERAAELVLKEHAGESNPEYLTDDFNSLSIT